MSEKAIYILMFLLGVTISDVSQLLLKTSAAKSYKSKIREYANVRVATTYALFS